MSGKYEQKYVRHSVIGFVLWPTQDKLWHAHIGAALHAVPGTIVSAGFCDVSTGIAVCWGESESLNIQSREEDSALLGKQLGIES